MDMDYGVLIGLIGVLLLAAVIGLSYAGAYLLGRVRGQRDGERMRRADERPEVRNDVRAAQGERLMVVESAIESLARAVERMTDAQRVALLQSRGAAQGNGSSPTPVAELRPARQNTPT